MTVKIFKMLNGTCLRTCAPCSHVYKEICLVKRANLEQNKQLERLISLEIM